MARLHSDGTFASQIAAVFEGDYKLNFHLAPPMISKRNASGELQKRAFGPWMMNTFRFLAMLKGLRGTPLDLFGYTYERKKERQLISDFEKLLSEIAANLTSDRHAAAVELASLPQKIRGFGHVKLDAILAYESEKDGLLEQFRSASERIAKAAE